MGESYAQNVGVSIRPLRVMLILLSSLLSACVTAFAGPISFVGIAVPHLVKRGKNDKADRDDTSQLSRRQCILCAVRLVGADDLCTG